MFGRHAVRDTISMRSSTTVRNASPDASPGPSNSTPNTMGPRHAAVYPTPWEKPDSAAEPAWVRRTLIGVALAICVGVAVWLVRLRPGTLAQVAVEVAIALAGVLPVGLGIGDR